MTKLKLFGCSVIVVMAIASFLLANNSSSKNEKSINMSNIEALHASAGEMWCDPPADVDCKITTADGDVGESKGVLRMIF